MELAQLEKELMVRAKWLTIKLGQQNDLVKSYADAEHDYRVELAKKQTELRLDKVQATLIPDLAKGDSVVAGLKRDRDIAKGVKDACVLSIRSMQATMSGIQSLISTKKEEMKLV
jgi:hypothetical protein